MTIMRLKRKFLESLESMDTEVHVLPLHFTSEETAERRRVWDDTDSSTFKASIPWKVVKKEIKNWIESSKSDAKFQEVLCQGEEWQNYLVWFGPYQMDIGVKFPICGNRQECRHFVLKFIVHKYTEFGEQCMDIRIKTIHPETAR